MKKTLFGCLSLLSCLALVGCGGAAPEKDAAALAEALATQISYEDALTKLDDDMVFKLYAVQAQDVKQAAVYVGSGATAEEVAVFLCTDGDAAQRVEQAAKKRLDQQKTSFVDYLPGEMPKLNDPVLIRNGSLVALCVSDDNQTAKKLIQG